MTATFAQARPESLDLASVEPFDIASLRVEPARRRVSWGDGCFKDLEPRVMKVLVVLSGARGEVVSRDRLIQLCWGDRIVGDDAVNRCIYVLRRLAATIEPPPFRIETTGRVGYALIADIANRPGTRSWQPRIVSALSPGGKIAAILLAGLALVAAAVLLWRSLTPDSGTVAIVAADGGRSAALANDLKSELARSSGASLTALSIVDSPDAALVMKLTSQRQGRITHANLDLVAGGDDRILWSTSLNSDSPEDLRMQLAARLANVLACGARIGSRDRLGVEAKRLFLGACERSDDMWSENDIGDLRQLTALAPRFAQGWSMLALAETELADSIDFEDNPEPARLRKRAAADLARARSLDAGLGTNYVVASFLVPAPDWASRLKLIEEGIARDPDEYLLYDRQSLLLAEVGLTEAAIAAAKRAMELRPLSNRAGASFVALLAHGGHLQQARTELQQASRLWPNSQSLRFDRFSIELRYGDARAAQRMIESGEAALLGSSGGSFEASRTLMRARLSPTPANIRTLIQLPKPDADTAAVTFYLQAMGQLGAVDEAYALLARPGATKALAIDPEILFRPHMLQFRRDRRFPVLAARLGLMKYWSESGRWPDFCRDPRLPYDCKTEAGRLLKA